MFYRPGLDPHGLPHNPFKAIVSPRPIGWISTLSAEGLPNLAPYSFFNAIADVPPMVAYASTGATKDTVTNIRATGEFVVNIVSMALRDAMNASSAALPRGVDEFEIADLEKAPSEIVAPPRVRDAPASLECRLWQSIDLPGEGNVLTIGEVVGVHINEAILRDGLVDVTLYQPLSRLGYRDYAAVREVFPLNRPGQT
ncbi:flavin reductase family protein [Amaricoccus sp. W119]|uniref:flavin reductase family protein n=1 Tax=Amaricoccus sp. W119 TaxID=3391833 RepID=UPI0039A401F8